MTEPLVLGVNSVYHESAACLFHGSRLLAFAEEERLNRVKHAKAPRVSNADVLPAAAIGYCLDRAGASWEDIDAIAYSFDPSLRGPAAAEPCLDGDWGSPDGEAAFLASLARVPDALLALAGRDVRDRLVWVPHHLAHAGSAYLASPFDDAAVLVVDGIGERATAFLGAGRGTALDELATVDYPHSLGFLWEKLSRFVGLGEYDAPKVMALAAFGDAERFAREMATLVRRGPGGFAVDHARLRFRVPDASGLEELFGPARRPGEHVDHRDADLAAALQAATEEVLLDLAADLRARTGSSNLAVAGGVMLNCVAMGRLAQSGPFDTVFVQPLAHDAGTALGAALVVLHARGVRSRFTMASPYLGPAFTADDCARALRAAGLPVRRLAAPTATAAELVAGGRIVGWFQGAAEVGPRALGNRSIVADPRRADSKERINLQVKHREYFRPFAPSVLEEHARDWFAFSFSSPSLDFMSFATPLRSEVAHSIPAVTHVAGTSRLQVVRSAVNRPYHELITRFHERTGVPLVLNTSFNTFDEPIVSSPADAIATFRRTGLDALVLGDCLVESPCVRLASPAVEVFA